jgi:LuxR family maltose regulon positive regulatory protein
MEHVVTMRDAGKGPVPATATRVNPLLSRKLVVPTSRTRVTPRPRLFQVLDASVDYPVVTLLAPAGWGKTTLLSS